MKRPVAKSDIYSLGVLAYEVITGIRPFRGRTQDEIIMAHLRKLPTNPKRHREELSQKVANVIMGALSRDPKKRYDSVKEFHDAFKKASGLFIEKKEEPSIAVGRASRTVKKENLEPEDKRKSVDSLLDRLFRQK